MMWFLDLKFESFTWFICSIRSSLSVNLTILAKLILLDGMSSDLDRVFKVAISVMILSSFDEIFERELLTRHSEQFHTL